MKSALIALSAALLLAAPADAMAQSTSAPAAPQTPAQETSPPPAANAGTPSEDRIAAALDLLKANHAIDTVKAVFDVMMPIEARQLKQMHPDLDNATITIIVGKVRDAMIARQDEMLRIYAIEYGRVFTAQELRDLAAFYRSNLGQKYITSIPTLLRDVTPILGRWAAGVAEDERENILRSVKKPEDHKS